MSLGIFLSHGLVILDNQLEKNQSYNPSLLRVIHTVLKQYESTSKKAPEQPAFNPSILEAEAWGLLWVPDQSNVYSAF